MSPCYECDCTAPGGYPHEPDCRSLDKCGEDGEALCDACLDAEARAHAYLAHLPLSAVTGVMSEAEKDDMRLAGRAHLVSP